MGPAARRLPVHRVFPGTGNCSGPTASRPGVKIPWLSDVTVHRAKPKALFRDESGRPAGIGLLRRESSPNIPDADFFRTRAKSNNGAIKAPRVYSPSKTNSIHGEEE
ncbi:hypothetical protein SKAU_G00379250 [Synaphobranchus kaupii]|uniref:Uncharacterized protein n=1 Tax=Synaphobranchus kaupii TaxID=118154 RepID=A0A9Q1IDM9_SYNKA|nr:hypothetical protein SKAU_G00379250 [Synaphobranchus kaupii]